MTHTPEPWLIAGDVIYAESDDTIHAGVIGNDRPRDCYILVICRPESKANARRIVAAVNATAGIPTEALEAGVLRKLIRHHEYVLHEAEWLIHRTNIPSNAKRSIVNRFHQARAAFAKVRAAFFEVLT